MKYVPLNAFINFSRYCKNHGMPIADVFNDIADIYNKTYNSEISKILPPVHSGQ